MNGKSSNNSSKSHDVLPLVVAPPLSPDVTFDADVALAYGLPLESSPFRKRG